MVKEEFYHRNMVKNLSWQYLKDSSAKIRVLVAGYYAKLEDIENLKKMNQEIKEFNAKCLKKYIKPYVDIPKRPCFPVAHYYRDLYILKGMVRNWFELEYRRCVRKMKKDGKSLPK